MRVVFDNGDIHALVPAGRFTIKANGKVEWHTPYSALVIHASAGDDEIFPAGVAEQWDGPIPDDLPRLPGLSAMEEWSNLPFGGVGPRGIRRYPGGFVTASASGHIVHVGETITGWRVPAGSENTLFAARAGDATLVGIRWNHRHSELFVVSGEKLLGRWPNDDEPRWGMPAPAVMGDYVVTYSDEGPFRKQLALLKLPTLEEIDHAPIPEWPNDLATDGERFAAVSHGYLVTGHVADGKLVIDSEVTIPEIMKRAGVSKTALADAATNDGRGTRTWFKEALQKLVVDDEEAIVLGPRGGVWAVSGAELTPIFEPFLPPGPDASARDRFFGPTRGLFDAHAGRLVISRGHELVLVDRATLTDILAVPAEGLGLKGHVFRDGMIYVVEERKDFGEEYVVRFVRPGSEPRILGRCNRSTGLHELPLSRTSDEVAWFELSEVDENYAFHVARFGGDEVTRTPLSSTVKGFAFHAGSAFTIRGNQLYKGDVQITTEPLPFGVRTVVGTGLYAFFIEPLTTGGNELNPSQLWRVDLATGAQSVVSTATVGAISSLAVVGETLWWLEARDASMKLLKLGEDEHVSAICSLSL